VPPGEDLSGQDQEVEAGPVSGTELLVPKEWMMCLLVKTSLGRIRRWRQDQCQVHNLLYPRDDMKMCFLMKIALGRIRRWSQD
jgi:hypothetical protein